MRGFADAFIDSIDYYRKSLVILNEGVTLTIEDEGSLIIGGYTGYAYSQTVGQTSKDYCEILMLSDSKIEAKGTSSITCYGYIKEATYIKDEDGNWNLYGQLNNGSRIEMSTESSFLAPLVFYDYKAGFNTLMMTNHDVKISPVEMFDFPNLQVETVFTSEGEKTSSFMAEYKIGVNGVAFTDTCQVVGYGEDAMIGLTEGSLSIKYTPRLAGFTQKQKGFKTYEKMESAGRCDGTQDEDSLYEERKSTSGFTSEDDNDCTYTTFRVNGTASLNKVTLKLKVALVSLDIDTSQYDFPDSY